MSLLSYSQTVMSRTVVGYIVAAHYLLFFQFSLFIIVATDNMNERKTIQPYSMD